MLVTISLTSAISIISMVFSIGDLSGYFALVLGGEAQRGNGDGGGMFEIFDKLTERDD